MIPPSSDPPAKDLAERWGAQLRKGSLELAILASLWESPRYGLEILQALDAAGLNLAEGTLYPILNRLRGDGLLLSEWRQEGTGNPRKYYALTAMGRTHARDIAKAWRAFSTTLERILDPLLAAQDQP